jgi:2-polyprenyl-6-methoxyphenol hydroxylase-like FAD-dependent oxidoreductase
VRIGIVGLGTAGAAASLFLSRAGHRVDLFERTAHPGPVGAGIMMQPSGLLVLERLGCVAPILSHGSRVDALVATTTTGRRVLDLAYGDLDEALFGIGLHRGVLFETLHDAVRASEAHLHLGVDIVKMRERMLVDADGEAHGPYDLVVLADGARSHLREALVGVRASVKPYPWGAMWFVGESHVPRRALAQFLEGTHHMIGVLPTGRGPSHDAPLASLFFSVEIARRDHVLAGGIDAWKRELLRVAPHDAVGDLVDQIEGFDALTFATYFDVSMPRWHCQNGAAHVVLLGDTAHATSPQLGQGCNLALCDAAALADALEAHGEDDVGTALASYTAERRDHLAFYQFATRAITPFFQSDSSAFGLMRDVFSPIALRVPFVRREMIRAMCGTKTGWMFGARETRMPR